MKKKIGIVESAMHYNSLVYFIVALLVVLGIVGLTQMPKQEFPVFTIRQGLIVGVYPGATSEQVEEQLAKPLEQFLFTYKEVKKKQTYTMSRNGVVYAMVELEDDVHNKDEVWSKIKHGISGLKMSLPPGVLALIVKDDFGDTSALLISLESDTKSYRDLEDYLEILEGKLRRIESVSNLRRYGLQEEQISVYLDKDKLSAYGIDHKMLGAKLFTQGFTTFAGNIETTTQELPIYISPVLDSEKEVAEQIIHSDPMGNIIRLKDVATIERGYEDPDSFIRNNGKKALILSMEMQEGNNIVQYGRDVEKVLAEFESLLPEDITIERIADQPEVVRDSVTSFLRDLMLSILVVILVMVVLFPFRSAIVAATTIPVSIFISLGIMYLFAIPLDTVTLAALIVVLGMIVDNSIVVVDGYLEYVDKGVSRWHAAVKSAKTYAGSIFLATLCICFIFFPMLFIFYGLWYDFIADFPWTLSISLMTSFLLAMIYIPFLEYLIIKKGLKEEEGSKPNIRTKFLNAVQGTYESILGWTFKHPYLTIGGGTVLVFISMFSFGNVKTRMFPFADRNQFALEIYMPHGTPLAGTEAVSDSIYNILKQDERIKSITSFIGCSSPRFQSAYAPNIGGKNYAQFIVNTESNKATIQVLDEYTEKYENYFPNAYLKFKQLDYQNVPLPIEVRFFGGDIPELKYYADTLISALRDVEGMVWLHTDFEEQLASVEIDINTTEASRLGVSRATLEREIAAQYEDVSAGTIWEGDHAIPVVLKTAQTAHYPELDKIGSQYINTMLPGVSVPLRQFAEVKPGWYDGQIVRRNGVRTITVLANVERGASESEIFKNIDAVMQEKIVPMLPPTIGYEYGGAHDKDEEAIPLIAKSILAAILLIFLFLLFNFKKITVALAALLSLFLCLPGVVFALKVTNTTFSITCVLGIISLMGIIVRNAIIMFDHAESMRINEKATAYQAAYDAGKRRMIPIFLTSATTAVGVVPMIVSRTMLWSPMGIVIFFGTMFAMIFVVTILPVTYWKIFDKAKIKEYKNGH